ncbi:hypothetical protein DFH11DRAFT_1745457 [Phellopilus nigrolimitatus]|nr:hypothetical protein DFH11DRAFT_1745457 [Phellopilus nigrolimitatus]
MLNSQSRTQICRLRPAAYILIPSTAIQTQDIIFQSSDGMHFKVHSPIIRLASDDFARVLNVSGASSPNPDQQAAVKLKEDQAIVKALLDSIYPRRSPPKLHPFSFVCRLASAAGKYDILDATHRIRASISRELPASSGTSLQHYALASGQGWESDARYASRFVPPPNPENPVEKPTLESMDTKSLLKLMDLHRCRHDMAIKAMTISYDKNAAKQTRQDHLRWEVIAKGHAGNCVSTAYDKAAWAAFQLHLLTEVDKLSPVDFEQRLKNGFWDGGELKALWDNKCTKCSKPFFNQRKSCKGVSAYCETFSNGSRLDCAPIEHPLARSICIRLST